jgi:hypothetical protein
VLLSNAPANEPRPEPKSRKAAPKLYPALSASLVTSPKVKKAGTTDFFLPVKPSTIPCNAGTKVSG